MTQSLNTTPPSASPTRVGRSMPHYLKGFTLVEIMFALVIIGMISAALAQFTIHTSRMMMDSTNKLNMSSDVRTFTSHISRDGKTARTFYIYPNYSATQTIGGRRSDGSSGDFVVFIWTEQDVTGGLPDPNITYLSRIVGYGRIVRDDGFGPVMRFERDLPRTNDYLTDAITIEELIAETMSGSFQDREVVQLARGLADQTLFHNFRDGSVIINGQIMHGNRVRNVTHTYNFTVTPRG